jgi:hypothetical protein
MFEPRVYYSKCLDSVRVYTSDCRVQAVKIDPLLTLYKRFPGREDGYIGFSINRAHTFCEDRGLIHDDFFHDSSFDPMGQKRPPAPPRKTQRRPLRIPHLNQKGDTSVSPFLYFIF